MTQQLALGDTLPDDTLPDDTLPDDTLPVDDAGEQLAMIDIEMQVITDWAASSPHARWWSRSLNVAVLTAMAHSEQPAVALFACWNLARMGPKRWHDLSAAQIASATPWARRRVSQMRRAAELCGWLTVRRRPGRRSLTTAGRFVAALLDESELREIDGRLAVLEASPAAAAARSQASAAAEKAAAKAAFADRFGPA